MMLFILLLKYKYPDEHSVDVISVFLFLSWEKSHTSKEVRVENAKQ